MEINKKTYSDKKVIAYYDQYKDLQKPEQYIFTFLQDKLPAFKMLDIGIGGGRTTLHFAPKVKEYIGVDYAEGMVEVCKNKYGSKFPNSTFEVADVRKLDKFKLNDFDFVFFSFNGIDYISANERFLAFKEINKVLKTDGYFCFSSHNIQSLENSNRFELRLNLYAWAKNLVVWQKIKRINKVQFKKVQTDDFVFINDGAHNFGLETCYIRPSSQLKILTEAGFKNIRFFSLKTGLEIDTKDISKATDAWIYYLCQKK